MHDLAHRLVIHEAGDSPRPATTAAAVEGICRAMRDDLRPMVGAGGVSALLTRALHLARRERSVLGGVTVDAGTEECFTGLTEALATSTDEGAVAAGASIVAQLLGLLVDLLGEQLGLQPVRKLWPQVASSGKEIEE